MVDLVRRPFHLLTVDGQELALDHGPQVTRGLNMLISECVVRIPYNAGTIVKVDSQIQVFGGLSASAARTRFVGFAERFDDTLWPGELALMCKGAMFLTELSRGADPGGTDLSNATRQDVIIVVLARSNVPVSLYGSLADDGTIIGTTAGVDDTRFRWMPGESGLSVIQRYDEASVQEDGSAYRVSEDAAGRIYSRKYSVVPPTTAAYSFYETADDMLESSHVVSEDKQAATRAEVKGFGDVSFAASVPYPGRTDSFQSSLIESTTIAEGIGISAERIAAGRLASGQFRFLTAEIHTHRDDPIGPGDVIYVESARMRVNQTFYVQQVVDSWDESNQFLKKITAVSELGLGTFNRTSAGQPFSTPLIAGVTIPTQPVVTGALPPLSPFLPTAMIHVINAVKERVIRAGTPTTIYEVSCEDVSTSPSGTIASRAWTASGTGAWPTSGTEQYFTAKFDGRSGVIGLTVTDALGNASVQATLDISTIDESQFKCRDLFSILQDGGSLGILEAFDGHDMTWRKYATGATATTLAVANGPCWAINDVVYRSADYLRTAPDTAQPAAGTNVAKLWIEPDVNINTVAAALADGRVALSTDAGATWTVKAGPDANPATWIILSRYAAGEIDLFSSSGFWQSPNNGDNWNLIQAGDYTFGDLNPFRNWGAAQISGVGKWVHAEDLTQITGTSTNDVRAVTSHIRLDRGYALAGTAKTYYLATDGASAASAGADVPGAWSGTVQDDVYRDGGLVDIVLFPVGAGGLGKTTDGFRTTTGYEQLRARSIDGANAAGVWPMLGLGLLSTVTPAAPGGATRIYVAGRSGTVWKSSDDGATWTGITAHGLGIGLFILTAAGGASGNDILYVASATVLKRSGDGGATWSTITTPSLSNIDWVEVAPDGTVVLGYDAVFSVSTNDGASWSSFAPTDANWPMSAGTAKFWISNFNSTALVNRANLDGSGGESIALASVWNSLAVPHAVSDSIALIVSSPFGSDDNLLDKVVGTTPTNIAPAGALSPNRWWDAASPDGTTIIAHIWDKNVNGDDTGELWRSTNGGSSWTKVADDVDLQPGSNWPSLAFDPGDPTKCYAMGGQYQENYARGIPAQIFSSTDGGATWSGAAIDAAEFALRCIRVVSE